MTAIEDGFYYRKQMGCQSGVIAWSHRARFKMALRLIGTMRPRLLDYGCGDGTFLAMAADHIETGWGADIHASQIKDCQTRLASIGKLRFCTVDELDGPTHDAAHDVVICMETLEHCTEPVVETVLRDLARLVAASGRVIISVPIEIGPTFLVKLILRKLAAWRGLSDYRHYESYSLRNALRMLFANRATVVERPVYGSGDEAPYYSHYGFNWRAFRQRLSGHFTIERTHFSPMGFLGGWVSSQVWFVCRPRTRLQGA